MNTCHQTGVMTRFILWYHFMISQINQHMSTCAVNAKFLSFAQHPCRPDLDTSHSATSMECRVPADLWVLFDHFRTCPRLMATPATPHDLEDPRKPWWWKLHAKSHSWDEGTTPSNARDVDRPGSANGQCWGIGPILGFKIWEPKRSKNVQKVNLFNYVYHLVMTNIAMENPHFL